MTKHFLIPLCVLALYASAAHGATVAQIATTCDVVVNGIITSRNETATNVSFDISVQRVLKGAAVPASVRVSHPWTRGGFNIGGSPEIIRTIQGIWCIQPSASGDWDVQGIGAGPDGLFVSLFLPSAAALPAAYRLQVPLPDALLFYIAAGVEADSMNPEIATGAAGGAQTSSLQIVANRFMSMSNPEFQLAGLVVSLLPTQPSLIGSVAALWTSISSNPRRSFLVLAIRETFRDPASRRARGVFGLSSFANECPAETSANVVSMGYLQCSSKGLTAPRTPLRTLRHRARRAIRLSNFGSTGGIKIGRR